LAVLIFLGISIKKVSVHETFLWKLFHLFFKYILSAAGEKNWKIQLFYPVWASNNLNLSAIGGGEACPHPPGYASQVYQDRYL